MVKVGLIGCGSIARHHVKGWERVQEKGLARVSATCDADAGQARVMAEQLGSAKAFDRWEPLFEEDLDAVDICLPHHLHRDAILAASEAGAHVLVEKPLCLTLQEAGEIRNVRKRSGISIMCAHNQIFHPAVVQARKAIEAGRIGRIFSARTLDCFHISRTQEEWGWRANLSTAGGGCLIDTGYHPSYLLLHLVGEKAESVFAMNGNFGQPLIEGEDSANVLVRFQSGAVGNIFTSWAGDPPGAGWQFEVTGEKGQVYGRGTQFFFKALKSEPVEEILDVSDAFEAEITHFVECIEKDSKPLQTEEDGIEVLKVILAAYTSDREGRVVTLDGDES